MPKSKYPQKLDTSVEIPPIRDNITEIGSDVINSLRSAIFRIEAVLGINPQGAAGNTVSLRLSRSLDSKGNILRDAIDRANILSGPVIDTDVSRVAAIQESKLKLDFPTTLLQDEISILNNELKTIKGALEELSLIFSIHTEPTALSRHSAVSIGVGAASVVASDIASLALATGSLQSVLEDLYNSHINYSGANISSLNNSHTASQIYYDTTNTSSIIFSDDIQGAIDDLVNVEAVGFKNAILNIASNGRIRTGSVIDDFEGNNLGSLLLDTSTATYIPSAGEAKTRFLLTTGQTPLGTILEFDILTLSGSINDSNNKEYQIAEAIVNGSGLLQEVVVYGGPLGNSESGLSIQISKNRYKPYNLGGFASAVRPRSNKTNTPDIQILNPDSATIISSGILPSNITMSTGSFDIIIDGGTPVTIDAYDSLASEQTIDSIVKAVNDQAVDQHLNITAFKVRTNLCFELAIAHNMPNIAGDTTNRTISISTGSSNDGTTELGFGKTLDIEVEGQTGNSLSLNGNILSGFGLVQGFGNSKMEIITGTLTLSLFSGTFAELGIRVGDIVIVTGSTDPTDDGSYRVGSLLDGVANLDLSGATFAGNLDDNSIVYIVRATADIGELTFQEILSTDGTLLFDVFMTEEKNIFNSKRLEVDGSIRSGTFSGVISDLSRGFIVSGDTATLTVDTSGFAVLTGPDLQDGAPVFVGATGVYHIFGSDGFSFITININASTPPAVEQKVTLYGFDEVSQNNYHLSRGGFSTSLGRILGGSNDPGVPILLDKRRSGTADSTIIGESFIERFIDGPRNELRASGIISGCLVSNVTYTDTGSEIYQNFSVGSGIAYVNGIRFEFPGAENIRINTEAEYYVVIDSRGCIAAQPAIDNPNNPGENISPFFKQEVATLAEVVNDTISATETDLRLFIDNLDLKVVGDIRVSPDSRHGHFTDLSKAIDYSKRFIKMFPDMGRPTILLENGLYEVSSTIILDFDISISGSGPGTIITKSGSLALGSQLSGDDVDMNTAMFMIGKDSETDISDIRYGVSLKNFTYETNNSLLENVGCVIALAQPINKNGSDVSREATYRIENITFAGPSTINGLVSDPNKIGEFAVVIGQQDSLTLAPISDVTMGNLILSNCRLDRMGLEEGAVKFTESSTSTMQDVIISNNIVTRGSPNLNSTNAIVVNYPTTPIVENIIEIGNIFRTAD